MPGPSRARCAPRSSFSTTSLPGSSSSHPSSVCSKVTTTRGGQRTELDIAFLPPVCSIGTFESKESLEESGADGSEVLVIWFQGAFGPPEPGHVADSIRAIAWDRFACGLHEL